MGQSTRSELEDRFEDHRATVTDTSPRVASADLLRGKRKLIIEHGETTYVLLLTRNGKLILNK
jgi:hemin uptake protein HemP